MRSAARVFLAALGAVALLACSKQPQNQVAQNDDMSLEANLAAGQLPPNTEIETLPPDESSGTPTGELNAGEDNPDVNDLDNSH